MPDATQQIESGQAFALTHPVQGARLVAQTVPLAVRLADRITSVASERARNLTARTLVAREPGAPQTDGLGDAHSVAGVAR